MKRLGINKAVSQDGGCDASCSFFYEPTEIPPIVASGVLRYPEKGEHYNSHQNPPTDLSRQDGG